MKCAKQLAITSHELAKAVDLQAHWCVLANVFLYLHDAQPLRVVWR
ncbi:MAG: hypothetical protein RL203_1319, partial [Pseudomonadota bacterium]